ncbi:MAG: hypothetical protein N3E52_02470 [Candidatus Bathyarchaeota archaeon]|nr:hypothetical protein [Candidatus Bathyarchaeota archaeon]
MPQIALDKQREYMKSVLTLFLVLIAFSATIISIVFIKYQSKSEVAKEEFFFGVMFGSNSTSEVKQLIDKVKDYTNLFIMGSWDININETALNEVCEYAAKAEMNFIVYFDFISFRVFPWLPAWLESASNRWGNKFLGIYLYDEPGGHQIDMNQWQTGESARRAMANATDYSDAANKFVTSIPASLSWRNLKSLNVSIPIFTSDYALYWFDYLAGYDTVFVELGWKTNTAQQIALCRGAANVQGKDWGAIITWTYYDEPYLASGPEIYKEMLAAYQAGAKYIVVFNHPKYPEDNVYGILTEEHFTAMKRFWHYIHAYPRELYGILKPEAAFVLPKDYGWGTRRSENIIEDRIWGFWPEDEKTPIIGGNMKKLLEKYGLRLDIIYDDPQFNYKEKYSKIYFWNATIT